MMMWLYHTLTVKIQKKITICWDITHIGRTSSCNPPKVPSKSTNSEFKTYKTMAVRSHFKIHSHFFGNPVRAGQYILKVTRE